MKTKIKQLILLAILFFGGLVLVQPAFAQSTTAATTSILKNGIIQCGNQDTLGTANYNYSNLDKEPNGRCTIKDIFVTIIRVINLLVGIAGLYAVIRIVWAGNVLIGSAGNEQKLQAGKDGLTHALLGLLIVIVAFGIIHWLAYLELKVDTPNVFENPLQFILGGK